MRSSRFCGLDSKSERLNFSIAPSWDANDEGRHGLAAKRLAMACSHYALHSPAGLPDRDRGSSEPCERTPGTRIRIGYTPKAVPEPWPCYPASAPRCGSLIRVHL